MHADIILACQLLMAAAWGLPCKMVRTSCHCSSGLLPVCCQGCRRSQLSTCSQANSLHLIIREAHPSILAGLLGISGASIVNPLLLDFGIHPQAAAATSTLMVLFTSSSAALSFGFSHQLNLQFALVFGLCCMAASLVGVILVQHVVERSGKVGDTDMLPSSGPLNAAVAAGQAGPCTKSGGKTVALGPESRCCWDIMKSPLSRGIAGWLCLSACIHSSEAHSCRHMHVSITGSHQCLHQHLCCNEAS